MTVALLHFYIGKCTRIGHVIFNALKVGETMDWVGSYCNSTFAQACGLICLAEYNIIKIGTSADY